MTVMDMNIKVKIISIGEGEMLPKQENFYNPHTCYTPIKIQITDNLMDTNKLSRLIMKKQEI